MIACFICEKRTYSPWQCWVICFMYYSSYISNFWRISFKIGAIILLLLVCNAKVLQYQFIAFLVWSTRCIFNYYLLVNRWRNIGKLCLICCYNDKYSKIFINNSILNLYSLSVFFLSVLTKYLSIYCIIFGNLLIIHSSIVWFAYELFRIF